MSIFSDQTHHKYRRRKLSDIAGDICRTTRVIGLSDDFHHGNRRLRGNSRNPAPNELVEHEITDHQNALLRKFTEEFFDALELHCLSRHIRKLSLLKEKFPF